MSEAVICAENLGKRYSIRHHHNHSRPYQTIRETVTEKVRQCFQRKGRLTSSETFEDFWALHDVSFEIKRGEAVGVIGRNGAGKSTLLKLISRITEPTTGRITLEGRVASLLEVGTGFHPELTGRENIFLNGAILGMKRHEIRLKFDDIVTFAGVEAFLDTPVKRYSSGMYVRLAFAVAAHLEPEILIVDEVLSVGDWEFQKKCLGKINEVATEEGRTVLFVSHQLDAIQKLCPKCIYLKSGTLAAVDRTDLVISSYLESSQHLESSASWATGIPAEGKAISIVGFSIAESGRELSVIANNPCTFTMDVFAREEHRAIRIAFGIDDKYGRRIFTLDSSRCHVAYNIPVGRSRITCYVGELPLRADHYSVHLFVGTDYGALDYVNGDATFNVLPSSDDRNAQRDESHGPVSVRQQWGKSNPL